MCLIGVLGALPAFTSSHHPSIAFGNGQALSVYSPESPETIRVEKRKELISQLSGPSVRGFTLGWDKGKQEQSPADVKPAPANTMTVVSLLHDHGDANEGVNLMRGGVMAYAGPVISESTYSVRIDPDSNRGGDLLAGSNYELGNRAPTFLSNRHDFLGTLLLVSVCTIIAGVVVWILRRRKSRETI
jgi:hypothetical protein